MGQKGHWFVLPVAGSSQTFFAMTPMCHGQDLAVLLHVVSLVTVPRAGTLGHSHPSNVFTSLTPKPGLKVPPFQPSHGPRMVLLVMGLFFKGKVNYKSLWGVLGSGDLCLQHPALRSATHQDNSSWWPCPV